MTEDRTIEKQDFRQGDWDNEYYDCVFEHCDFSDTEIKDVYFENCRFRFCNFSLSKLRCNFRDAKFVECRMSGADFSGVSRLAVSFAFEKSNLSYASFIRTKLREMRFSACNLNEAYFDEADISSSVFDRCEMERTSFYQTNLEKVDFSTSFNFTIDPASNRLKKAVFSVDGLRGLVSHLNIVVKEPDEL